MEELNREGNENVTPEPVMTSGGNDAVVVIEETVVIATPETMLKPSLTERFPFLANKPLLLATSIAILLLAGAGYYVYIDKYFHGGTVAVVNGERIYLNELNENFELVKRSASLQGYDVTDAEFVSQVRAQALDVLIQNTLVSTAAKKAGVTVSNDEVKVKLDELIAQVGGDEALTGRLGELGLDRAKFEANVEERLLADKYIESVTDIEDITATDDEINALLATIPKDGPNLPPADVLRDEAKQQIVSDKQQKLITDLLQKLRDEAKIETRI